MEALLENRAIPTLKLKNLDALLRLKVGDLVRVKEGKNRTAISLDWETVNDWWDGVITGIDISEKKVFESRRGGRDPRIIPAGTPTFRIAPRGDVKLSYLTTPGYLDDVRNGRDLSFWLQRKRHIFRWGMWIYPKDGEQIERRY